MSIYILYCMLMFAILCIFIIILFLSYLLFLRWKYYNIPGPQPSSFIFGHALIIRELRQKNEYHHNLWLDWARIFGPVYKLFFLHKCFIIGTSPELIKEILTKSKHPKSKMVYKSLYKTCGERFLGEGLVTNIDHQNWRKRKSLVNPAFHKRCLKTYMDQFNHVAENWMEKLAGIADGSTSFKMLDSLYRVTLDTIAKVGFNMDIGALEETNNEFIARLSAVLKGIHVTTHDPFFMYKKSNKAQVKYVQQSVKFIRQRCKDAITKRMEQINNGLDLPTDILTYLVGTKEKLSSLDLENVIDDFVTILFAGQETTSNTLGFLFGEIGRKPIILKKLIEEIKVVVGEDNYITYDHVLKLDYMSQVFKETLRLYPVAPATVRDLKESTIINGVKIPANSTIIIPFYIIHRLPQYYENPLEFNPERFGPNNQRQMFTYLPFSLGQRSCAGQQFAQIEAKVLLTKFLQRFEFELDTEQSFKVIEQTTLRPLDGTIMTIRPRH